MPRVIFVDSNGSRREVEAEAGASVLDAAQGNGIDIEGACEGVMACSTCHVIVDGDWADKLDAPSEEEEFMLDLAFGLTRTARLGCQIALTDALDGLVGAGALTETPLVAQVAAVSTGIVDGQVLLDLDYSEDSRADTDMNFVMDNEGRFIEIQGTAEIAPFTEDELRQLTVVAAKGISQLTDLQNAARRSE